MAHFLLAWNFDADPAHLLVYGNAKDYPNVTQFTSGVFSFRNGKQKAGFWNYHAVWEYRGAGKSLARAGRKQATATKL